MTHQPDHENTADKAAVTPPPALTTEGRLRARVQTLEEDAERNQGLAKVGARCMREGHQGLIESGRATVEGHRFALSVALDLGTGATWDAIHERVKELRRDSAEAAAVSATVAPPTQAAPSLRAGLRDEIVKALGRITTVPPVAHRREQADHVLAVLYREWPWLRAEAEDDEPTDRAAVIRAIADALVRMDAMVWLGCRRGDRDHDEPIGQEALAERLADAVLRRLADETPHTQTTPEACAHCGNPIRRVTSNLAAWWVHDPGGNTLCDWARPATSTRATPPAAGARQDGDQPS